MKLRIHLPALALVAGCSLLFSIAQQPSFSGTNRFDSLRKAIEAHPRDTNKVMLLNQLSFEYNSVSPYDGIRYAMQAQVLAEELNYKPGLARANSTLGANYFSLADYPNAYKYWLAALSINEEVGNKNGIANHLHNIGLVFFSQKQYDKALEYYEKALAVSKEIGNKKFASNSYTAMGNVHMQQKDLTRALEYHFKAMAMDEDGGGPKAVSTDMLNIAEVYFEQRDFARAGDMASKALEIKKSVSDKMGMAKAYNLGAKILLQGTDTVMGATRVQAALSMLDSAVALSRDIGFLENLQQSYEMLSAVEESRGNYKEALSNLRKYQVIRDSVYSESRRNQIVNLEKKSELERQLRESERMEREKDRRKYLQIFGISLFIISAIVALLIMYRIRVRPSVLKIISSAALIVLFDFIQLLLHQPIGKITHHDLLYTFLLSLALGAIIIPVHHKVEHWVKKKLEERTKPATPPPASQT
jgi:tetratricopeptide (TPR) repeat protein